uniref:Receptor-type tyrosine-protein phosphatase-like N isoform X2 n=1 Tax=Geotrypetes seraphini TaxID=260995 RepID=A0A6P8QWX4_GEOSA|nr:receptor-type tyrosine-protein phosphatase-like N isoform X2 [Geotrypetes seraphini]
MRLKRLRAALGLALLVLSWQGGASTRTHDGLFGHCQGRSLQEKTFFEVTPGTLQRLQDLLYQLLAEGLSWRDDITQHIISQEMDRILMLHPQQPLKPVTGDRLFNPPSSIKRPQYPDEQVQTGALQKSQYLGQTFQMGTGGLVQYPGQRLQYPGKQMGETFQYPGQQSQQLAPSLVQQHLSSSQAGMNHLNKLLESVQQPFPYYKFGYPEYIKQVNSANNEPILTAIPHDPMEESASTASRTSTQESKKLIWANIPSSVQQQSFNGQLLQSLASLYLPKERSSWKGNGREETVKHRNSLDDYSLGYLGKKEQPQNLEYRSANSVTDVAVQPLLGLLAEYGVKLSDLNEQQLKSLSALAQLLQRSGVLKYEDLIPRLVSEGEMQHGPGTLHPPSNYPVTEGVLDTMGTQSTVGQRMPAWPAALETSPESGEQNAQLQTTPSTAETWGRVAPQTLQGVTATSMPVFLQKKRYSESKELNMKPGHPHSHTAEEYGYIITEDKPLSLASGVQLLEVLAERIHLSTDSFINISIVGSALTFRIRPNNQNLSLTDVTNQAAAVKADLETETGLKIIQTGVGQRNAAKLFPHSAHFGDTFRFVLLTFIAVACIAGIVIAATVIFCLRQHAKQREKERLAALVPEGAVDSSLEYQKLCRQHMAAKSLFSRSEASAATAENSRISSVSSQFSDLPQASPSSHSSTPSWCEEPVQSNMDISTGHMILAYMEDHLRNRDRLAKEWHALCQYQAEPNSCALAKGESNLKKNRNPDYVPYDHTRIKLKVDNNPSRSDFINASPIIDHDPRMPAYIATQGPLSHTIADFWQMVWENGCTVIVMLSPLVEDAVKQCDRYWPDEGSSLYHIYEVNLVSEHIWCEDFLVRSFYLKNVQSQETRTLTQFHFLSWPAEGIPTTTQPLLDFRRKVNKCYRGRSCPIIIHCSEGAGRTGTYLLIDMVLNRMAKGVKEIDIAATLEHIRDQRSGMVCTKDQFEFALTAVAEEVNAILKALPQ